MLDIWRSVENIQEKVEFQTSTFATLRLHEVIENLDLKMKFYAEAIKFAHIYFGQNQEIEMSSHINLLVEKMNEELKSVVTKFLTERLNVPKLDLAQAFCIGNKEGQLRVIVVKFVDQAQRDTTIANKTNLEERRIRSDPNLIHLQVEARSNKLTKVKKSSSNRFCRLSTR